MWQERPPRPSGAGQKNAATRISIIEGKKDKPMQRVMGLQCRLPFWYVELRFWNHRLWLWEYFCHTYDWTGRARLVWHEGKVDPHKCQVEKTPSLPLSDVYNKERSSGPVSPVPSRILRPILVQLKALIWYRQHWNSIVTTLKVLRTLLARLCLQNLSHCTLCLGILGAKKKHKVNNLK